ncbi:paeninodin family lasso peptide [Ornithinibacillus californiensis]|nr:paeninodin family lasso peptide [Ornithinibacillus californiensis]
MKKEWKQPALEILDFRYTLMGPGIRDVDFTYEDEDEVAHLHKS